MRFASLLVGLLLVSALFKESMALAHPGAVTTSDGNDYIEAKDDDATSINEGLPSNAIVTQSQDPRMKGRKMITEKEVRKEVMKDEGVKGGSSESNSTSTQNARKCIHERKEFDVKSKLISYESLLHMKVNMVGLLFSADYNVPRPHPPKNN